MLRMYEWLFEPPGSRPALFDPGRGLADLRAAIDSNDAAVLVCEDEGELAGLCTVYLDLRSVRYGSRAWVEDLAVDPRKRSRGFGKALLDAAKGWARARGATHLELDSSVARADAHRFYEREGPSWRTNCYGWEL